MTAKRKRIILSIDGGGARALLPLRVLEALQHRLMAQGKTKPLHAYFDLVCGTSTGGMIAAGLCAPKPDEDALGIPALDLVELRGFFEDETRELYISGHNSKLTRMIKQPFGQFNKALQERPTEKLLKQRIGWSSVASSLTGIVLPAYDVAARRLVLMSNERPASEGSYNDYYFWQAVRATTAAPSWFEPARVENLATGEEHVMIDPSPFLNDPVMIAYAEARKRGWEPEDLVIVSLGTGNPTNQGFPFTEVSSWSSGTWMSPEKGVPLLSFLIDGQTRAKGVEASALLADIAGLEYHRITTDLPEGLADFHDPRPRYMSQLNEVAEQMIRDHGGELDALAQKIEERADGPGY
ncbi:patatin [Rhodobacteraceae bacterium RKSG542]|uniref:patatin-like phospholipase family protein n=1 Tax=Pseudovibrio flavus TaxID=2529854 RepID=UPI0012BCE457|nr:patatin-like phospholipase family protein [Pseudovibrio flavus]MTI17242.1 patatin [Pseudovibrio flavus]